MTDNLLLRCVPYTPMQISVILVKADRTMPSILKDLPEQASHKSVESTK